MGLDAHRKLIRQGKLPRAPRTALVYGADVHLWEDANGLDCDPRVEPKANASCDAHRPPICQGVPVDRAAREGNRFRPIHDGTPASGSWCKKVRRRRRMDAASALGRAGRCDLQEYPLMGRSGRAPAPPAGEVLLQRTAGPYIGSQTRRREHEQDYRVAAGHDIFARVPCFIARHVCGANRLGLRPR
jgi:hypothetical protein